MLNKEMISVIIAYVMPRRLYDARGDNFIVVVYIELII